MANPATRRFEYYLSRVVQSVRQRTVNPSHKLGDYTEKQEDRMSSRFGQNMLKSSESTRMQQPPSKAVLSQEQMLALNR